MAFFPGNQPGLQFRPLASLTLYALCCFMFLYVTSFSIVLYITSKMFLFSLSVHDLLDFFVLTDMMLNIWMSVTWYICTSTTSLALWLWLFISPRLSWHLWPWNGMIGWLFHHTVSPLRTFRYVNTDFKTNCMYLCIGY